MSKLRAENEPEIIWDNKSRFPIFRVLSPRPMFENSYLLLPVAGQLPPGSGVPAGAGDLVAPDRDEAGVVLVSPV